MANTLYSAFLQTRYASEYLLTAYTLESVPEKSPDTWVKVGVDRLKDAADALGYDLVKREQKQEAA
jgi:hypothetical protein